MAERVVVSPKAAVCTIAASEIWPSLAPFGIVVENDALPSAPVDSTDEVIAGTPGIARVNVTFAPGSFFTDELPKADVVLMGHILHDWDLPTKKMLIEKAFTAIPSGGALIIYESIIDDDRSKNAFGLLMSLNMLIETPAGFDYTGADCEGWMKEAGFSSTRVEPLVGPDSMVVGVK